MTKTTTSLKGVQKQAMKTSSGTSLSSSARKMRKSLLSELVTKLDDDFVTAQQTTISEKGLPLKRPKKAVVPVTRKELEDSIEKIEALLRTT